MLIERLKDLVKKVAKSVDLLPKWNEEAALSVAHKKDSRLRYISLSFFLMRLDKEILIRF